MEPIGDGPVIVGLAMDPDREHPTFATANEAKKYIESILID
jgi:hypothetical protein